MVDKRLVELLEVQQEQLRLQQEQHQKQQEMHRQDMHKMMRPIEMFSQQQQPTAIQSQRTSIQSFQKFSRSIAHLHYELIFGNIFKHFLLPIPFKIQRKHRLFLRTRAILGRFRSSASSSASFKLRKRSAHFRRESPLKVALNTLAQFEFSTKSRTE